MIGAGLVDVFLGVNAENKSLADIADPLSKTDVLQQEAHPT
ncbi:hypothetical protein [Humibacter antri]